MRFTQLARIVCSVLLVALACVWSAATLPSALAWAEPTALPDIPDGIIRPHIAGEGNRLHVIFQQDNAQQLFYSRGTANAAGEVSWQSPQLIATGVRYAWNVVAANGVVHVAYSSTRNEIMYMSNTQQGEASGWSTPERVATVSDRTNDLDIALDQTGTPYIAWGEGASPSKLVLAYRTVAGVWSRQEDSRNLYLVRNPKLVVTGNGDSATIHIMTEFQYRAGTTFYVGYTRGGRDSGLQTSSFSQSFPDAGTGDKPTIALDSASGALYAGFVTGSIANGYQLKFSYSADNGLSWMSVARLSLGNDLWADLTPMVADRGTVYLMLPAKEWTGNGFASSGFYDIRYVATSNAFTDAQAIRSNAGTNGGNASPDYDLNNVAKVATWATDNTRGIAYNSDPGGRAEPINATVVINGGAPATANPSVMIQIQNVTGSPTQMRVALDGDPTDATPLEPFQSSFARSFNGSSACQRTVAIQLFGASGSKSEILRASIIVDTQVQANALVRNPHLRTNASSDTPSSTVVDNGDPGYTRDPNVYIEINGVSECSGLSKLRIGRDESSLSQTYTLNGTFFAGVIPLPAPVAVGTNNLLVEITDSLGNVQRSAQSIIYDPTPPVLTTRGTLMVSAPNSAANVLTNLAFSGNVVSDTIYPGRGFWGVWLANSRTALADPASDPALDWSAVAAPGLTSDVTIMNWSILGGIPAAQQTPGVYYVYARFLDGAGNPTSAVISGTITIDEVRRPLTLLPIITKN